MALRSSPLARRLGVEVPIVQAPMAGGPSTPRLAAAVSQAGGLGSVAGAMLEPEDLRAAIRETRSLTDKPFAVNLFAPLPEPSMRHTAEWATVTGRPMPPVKPVPRFSDQLAVVVEERVPVFSFTFGVPPLDGVEAFTIGTATTVAEAVELEKAGVDAVVAQGLEAGGHRGTFLAPVERSLVGTLALVPHIVDAVSIPVLAAGGIMDGRGVAAALALGAGGVQLGTAFLASDEAGTSPTHRRALSQDTTLTRVLTGRYARVVRTPVVERLEASGQEPPDYPLPRFFLSEPPMMVGQGGPWARSVPAGDLVSTLITETEAAIAAICSPRAGTTRFDSS
jgi:nitronate monooxygenase